MKETRKKSPFVKGTAVGVIAAAITLLATVALRPTPSLAGLKGSIKISGAWALYPMVVRWAEVFEKQNPGVRIDVSAGGAGKGATDALAGVVDIGMVSRDIHPDEVRKGGFWVPVVKDAVFPAVNSNNPVIGELRKRGIKQDTFEAIWITGKVTTWGQVVRTKNRSRVHVYTRSDACGAAETWAQYLGKRQDDLKGVGVYGDPGLAQAVIKDPLGIGFNNLNFAYDSRSERPLRGLFIVPIDVNGNGKVDKNEDFYDTKDEALAAVGDGRYPSPPARDLNFLSKGKPRGVTQAFIRWALTDGQKYAKEAGYIPLPAAKKKQALDKVD